MQSPSFSYSAAASIAAWDNGYFYGESSMIAMPGLLGHEHGGLFFRQQFGNLTLAGGVTADKYGVYRGLHTVYGVSGLGTYRFNDALSLTVFGAYYNQNPFVSFAAMPYMASMNYGAYLSVNFDEHWGVDLGAQGMYDTYYRRWTAAPIVRPYYKLGQDVKIGVDVGGIVHGILRETVFDGRGGNSVIDPREGLLKAVPPPRR